MLQICLTVKFLTLDFYWTHRHRAAHKIKVGSFLPGTLPSALYPARHQPFPSFRVLQAVPIFAGKTNKYRILWQTIHLPPMSFSP